jgi:hypothetical protein
MGHSYSTSSQAPQYLSSQRREISTGRGIQSTDHDVPTGIELSESFMAHGLQSTAHRVPHDRITDGLGNNEPKAHVVI